MKVCHLLNHLATGGAEMLVLEMIRHTDREDVSYTVMHLGGTSELRPEFEAAGADIVDLRSGTRPAQLDPRVPGRLFSALRDGEYDVVHAHMPYMHVMGRLSGTLFDAGAVVSTQHIVRDSLHVAAATLGSLTQPLDSATVAVSEGVQTSFTGRSNVYRDSGRDGRWCTIHNGIDVESFREAVEGSRVRADGDEERIELLNVARYAPAKRQADLIRAMELVRERMPHSHLSIVGSGGPLEDDLRAEVRRRGLQDHVTVTGYVEDIHEYYAMADVFLSASDFEGLPITLLEAMAAGLPVVATDIPGVNEVVDEGESGYLVPSADPESMAEAIVSLAAESKRDRFGRNSYRRVKDRFSIEETVGSYLELYDEVASS